MRRQLLAALFYSLSLSACDSPYTREAVVGVYRSTSAPGLTLELRLDGKVLEKIGGTELVGRWTLWTNMERAYGGPRSQIELTGLVFAAGEAQSNNRIVAHLEKWPRRLVLDLENAKKLELSAEDTPR